MEARRQRGGGGGGRKEEEEDGSGLNGVRWEWRGANRAESRAPRNRIHASPRPANTICTHHQLPRTLSSAASHPPEILSSALRLNTNSLSLSLSSPSSFSSPSPLFSFLSNSNSFTYSLLFLAWKNRCTKNDRFSSHTGPSPVFI